MERCDEHEAARDKRGVMCLCTNKSVEEDVVSGECCEQSRVRPCCRCAETEELVGGEWGKGK